MATDITDFLDEELYLSIPELWRKVVVKARQKKLNPDEGALVIWSGVGGQRRVEALTPYGRSVLLDLLKSKVPVNQIAERFKVYRKIITRLCRKDNELWRLYPKKRALFLPDYVDTKYIHWEHRPNKVPVPHFTPEGVKKYRQLRREGNHQKDIAKFFCLGPTVLCKLVKRYPDIHQGILNKFTELTPRGVAINDEGIDRIVWEFEQEASVSEVAEILDISPNVLRRYRQMVPALAAAWPKSCSDLEERRCMACGTFFNYSKGPQDRICKNCRRKQG